MQKILVTGSTGQLGSEVKDLVSNYPQYHFVFTERTTLPLDDLAAIKSVLMAEQPDYIINAGAYTAVDQAESEVELADRVNHQAVAVMGAWCEQHNKHLIHLSTDYVFDGQSTKALSELAATHPLNVYGATKRAGEQALQAVHPEAIILRTSWVYSAYGNNFVKTMCRLMQERARISVVEDQIGTPTYAQDLAKVILHIVASQKWIGGIYHYSNEGAISWFEFASQIKAITGAECEVCATSSVAFPTVAKRPSFSLLDKRKIKEVYGIEIPDWKISLAKMLAQIGHNKES